MMNETEKINRRPSAPLHVQKPSWLKTKIPTGKVFFDIKKDLREKNLVTVCEEAKCPNIGECWNTGTATFMILGDTCTRACRFCHIKTGNPQGFFDPKEPKKIADSCELMKLKYVVITMVDRDDMPDGGAGHVYNVVSAVKTRCPEIKIELLAGDFANKKDSLNRLVEGPIEVFAHNIETVERLTPRVRDARANYRQSLEVLAYMKKSSGGRLLTKSAIMLGLGEEHEEVVQSLKDLRAACVDLVTIGQYMRPTKKHLAIKKWIEPSYFKELKKIAIDLGFLGVVSGPLVRSSYRASEFYIDAISSKTT